MSGAEPERRVRLTLDAVVEPDGRYRVDYAGELATETGKTFPVYMASWYSPDAPCLVDVEEITEATGEPPRGAVEHYAEAIRCLDRADRTKPSKLSRDLYLAAQANAALARTAVMVAALRDDLPMGQLDEWVRAGVL